MGADRHHALRLRPSLFPAPDHAFAARDLVHAHRLGRGTLCPADSAQMVPALGDRLGTHQARAVGAVCRRSHRRGDQAGVSRGPGPARTAPPRTRARSGAGTLAGRRTGLGALRCHRPARPGDPGSAECELRLDLGLLGGPPARAMTRPSYLTRWSSDRRSAPAEDQAPRPLRWKLFAAGTVPAPAPAVQREAIRLPVKSVLALPRVRRLRRLRTVAGNE